MASGKCLTVLHLSDPQFGPKHGFPEGASTRSLVDRLGTSLARLRDDEHIKPDLVLVSGDLTEQGTPAQFEQVDEFIRGLARYLAIGIDRVVVIPGNHDITRKFARAYFDRCEVYGHQPAQPYWPKYEPYAKFFEKLYQGTPGIEFTEAEPWSLFTYPDLGVVVAGINSTIADSHRDEDHYGFIGDEQLRWFAKKLQPAGEQGYLRICVVHHDPLNSGQMGGLRDAVSLETQLVPHLDLMLHGHTHEDQQRLFGHATSATLLLGIGSVGVVHAARPDEIGNQYQVLRLSKDSVEIYLRRYDPRRSDWIGDTRVDPEGKRSFIRIERQELQRAYAAFTLDTQEETAPCDELADALEQYRERMAHTHRARHFIEQSGLLDDEHTGGPIDLLRIFVIPQVEKRDEDIRNASKDALLAPFPEKNQEETTPQVPPTFPEDADKVLFDATQPWLLISGGPGSGKSTLSSWLVLQLCVADEHLPDSSLEEFIPVRIEMRRFALGRRERKGQEYTFFDYLQNEHVELSMDLMRADRLRALAEKGRLWWIFDGLDEIVDVAERQRCIEMIGALKQRYGGRGLITSREVGSDGVVRALSTLGIPHYGIVEFDNDRLLKLLERFPMPNARRERLISSFARSPALHEVCRVPLVATMVALLSRRRDIPERRRALYVELIELLVDKWEELKGTGPDERVLAQFDYGVKTKFLTSLAYHMMTQIEGGRGNVIREEELLDFAVDFCVEELRETELVAGKTAKQLLSRLRERHGVLVYWGADAYGFVHRSFLDALAAEQLGERYRNGIGRDEFAKRVRTSWNSPEWRECLVLALGGIAEKRPAEALTILQAALRAVELLEAELSLFAAFCIRVLSESGRALELEPLYGFAIRLTELIRICGTGYFYEGEGGQRTTALLHAFREIGSRWPGASILRAWALDEQTLRHSFSDDNIARIAIATTPPAEHLPLLQDLLAHFPDPYVFSFAVHESCLWRTWHATEIQKLLAATRAVNDVVALRASVAFLHNGYAVAMDTLVDLLQTSRAESIRMEAGAVLLSIKSARGWPAAPWRDMRLEALKTILDILEKVANAPTPSSHIVQSALVGIEGPDEDKFLTATLARWVEADIEYKTPFAATVLALRGDTKAIGILEAIARGNEAQQAQFAIAALLQIANYRQPARDTVLALLSVALLLDEYAAEMLFRWARRQRTPDVVKTLTSFVHLPDSTSDPGRKLRIATHLRGVSDLEPRGTRMLLDIARSSADTETRERALESLCGNLPPVGEFALQELLDIYGATTVRPSTHYAVANALVRSEIQNPHLRKAGGHIFTNLVAPEIQSDIRLPAAIHLRELGSPLGEVILRELAHTPSIDERTRRFAARVLRDVPTLRLLADTAESEQVRNEAAHFLALLDARRALLRVGRMRRGIVSLSGERVGIIAETPTGSRFTYDQAWLDRPDAKPIGPSVPLRHAPYESEGLHPFFENLLPEGWLLQIARKTLGAEAEDAFGLLLATCRDNIGAVEVIPEPDQDDE